MTLEALAARLRAGRPLTGLFAKMPCAAQIEAAGYAGFDAILLDTEHGPPDGLELEHHLRAAAAVKIPAVVRVPGIEPSAILAALDAGAAGVLVPHVLDAAGAAAVVAAAHYPPRGHRGLALSTRAGRYGSTSIDEHLRRAADETVVAVQIEDAEAVPRAAEILAVPGVDCVLIGATDLSISLGRPGQPSHPDVTQAIERILAAAAARKVSAAVVVRDAGEARAWRARGASLTVLVASQLVHDAFATAASEARSPVGTAREPLLLLPGTLCGWDLWADVAQALQDVAAPRLARIDLDGSIQAMADTVLASAPERFAMAGHSQGAIVALQTITRDPARVTRLALLNASAAPPSKAQQAAWEQLRVRADANDFGGIAAEFGVDNLPESRRSDETLVRRMEAMAHQVGRDGLLRQLAAQQTRPDLRPFLKQIACPTLVISGAKDQVSPPELQQELAAAIPGARVETIEECGHMSPLEVPDTVASLLREWLA